MNDNSPFTLFCKITNKSTITMTYRANKTVTSIHRLYIQPPHTLRKNFINTDFTTFYFTLDSFNVLLI